MNKVIYWAAPLFNEIELARNKECVGKLRENGYIVYLPQEAGLCSNGLDPIKAYEQDIEALKACDVVIACALGTRYDPGTMFEVGYASCLGKKVIIYGSVSNAMFSRLPQTGSLDEIITKIL